MKKALLLASILFVSVMSTACINNFAVQELNSKAKIYMEEGDYNAAIERLKSSIDLDDTIFETHYNLAVAYTQAEDYANAIESYKEAIELDPDMPDSYYSLAVAEENLTVDLKSGDVRLNDDGDIYTPEIEDTEEEVYVPDEKVLEKINFLREDALKNYRTYLEKAPQSADAEEVKQKIEALKSALQAPAVEQ